MRNGQFSIRLIKHLHIIQFLYNISVIYLRAPIFFYAVVKIYYFLRLSVINTITISVYITVCRSSFFNFLNSYLKSTQVDIYIIVGYVRARASYRSKKKSFFLFFKKHPITPSAGIRHITYILCRNSLLIYTMRFYWFCACNFSVQSRDFQTPGNHC